MERNIKRWTEILMDFLTLVLVTVLPITITLSRISGDIQPPF